MERWGRLVSRAPEAIRSGLRHIRSSALRIILFPRVHATVAATALFSNLRVARLTGSRCTAAVPVSFVWSIRPA